VATEPKLKSGAIFKTMYLITKFSHLGNNDFQVIDIIPTAVANPLNER